MPRGVKKNLEVVAKRTSAARDSKTLADQRIKGDVPAIGLVIVVKAKKAKKPALKKTNSKGQVIKRKGASTPYYSLIKRCLKQDKSRKGTYEFLFLEFTRSMCY
jgi:hypothetical protein